jgi:ankyrin repeat protein
VKGTGSLRKILFLSVFILLPAVIIFSGCKGREGYKKAIEKKGIPYSQEAFLDNVRTGDRELVEMFLSAGMDVNAKDKDGCTALMIASEKGDLGTAELLVRKGADVNARDIGGYTVLMYVAYNGNLDIAKLLIENKADVGAKDNDGWTALMFGSLGGKTEMVKLLKKSGTGSGGGKGR